MHPAVTSLVILGAGLAGMAGLRALRGFVAAEAETLRKAMHLWTGGVALSFPWLFDTAWPPLVIAAAGALILLASGTGFPLHRWLGGVVDGVARRTHGEFYFLAAVALLFPIAGDDTLLYTVPVLVLTLADTAAALVGRRFGRHVYVVAGTPKSVEGSIAFLVVAAFCVYLPLAGLLGMDPLRTASAAGAVALAAAAIEGLSPNGLDNLTVPLGVLASLNLVLPG